MSTHTTTHPAPVNVTGHTPTGAFLTLTRGTLAYVDAFGALVPVKVERVGLDGSAHVRVTAERGAYKRGERLTYTAGAIAQGALVPRTAVYRSRQACGQYRVVGLPVVAYSDGYRAGDRVDVYGVGACVVDDAAPGADTIAVRRIVGEAGARALTSRSSFRTHLDNVN